jgi:amidase
VDSARRPAVTRTDSPGSRREWQAEDPQHQRVARRRPRRRSVARNLALCVAIGAAVAVAAPMASAAPVLELETLTAPQAAAMMESGELTSVQLTRAYLARIEALNKRGPGLNAVSQLNPNALKEAAIADRERTKGIIRGPAHGMPVLMKDLIDVKGMYTSAGNYSLRNSFPQNDSGVAAQLRANGAVILGKLGLSEYANSFGNQPSGFGNLTGQVLNAIDADQNVSGSSSGSGPAAANAMAMLVIGTETSGSIISPANANGIVGIRPTIGLVPGNGIAPIGAAQDTAGPMDRTVSDAAFTLQAIAKPNSAAYAGLWDPRDDADITEDDPRVNDDDVVPPSPAETPGYISALDLDFVKGMRIGYTADPTVPGPFKDAFDALYEAGAILVPRPNPFGLPTAEEPFRNPTAAVAGLPPGTNSYEAKRDITRYYENLGPDAPIKSLAEEIAANQAEPHQALKFGNSSHLGHQNNNDLDPLSASSRQYRLNLVAGKRMTQQFIKDMVGNFSDDPGDDFVAILGPLPNGSLARAGTPTITVPMGYNETNRRTLNVQVHGTAYSERDLIGIAYVIEQGTLKRQAPPAINPSFYRCADLDPAPPFTERGACNPDYDEIMAMIGKETTLDFALENESVESLQQRMESKSLTAETLTRAYLTRIALANAEGPAIQAVRSVDSRALSRAKALDKERRQKGSRGPLHGIPVLLDDSIDVAGLPTTGGSIALQHSRPAASAELVKRLEAAGAIVLGKANTTEFSGMVDPLMPTGYSSLAGQVLLPSDTDKPRRGSSAGSAAATASGMAAMTVGLQTSPDSAELIPAASAAGVVALKPTVGRVSRAGILPIARTQDSPGPITRTVSDAATQLKATAGADPADPATAGAPEAPDYVAALDIDALSGARVATVGEVSGQVQIRQPQVYASAIDAVKGAGATTAPVSVATPLSTASIVPREFKRDLNAYLAGVPGPGAKSLAEVIAYNQDNPIEGLKYGQSTLAAANGVDLSDAASLAAYEDDKASGIAEARGLIDGILGANPADPGDDFDVIMVPLNTNTYTDASRLKHLPEVNVLLEAADRAGYPVLTVPAGFGTTVPGVAHQGRNPYGVAFISTAFSEDKLLSFGFAFEQKTKVRLDPEAAPSWTNPSMWRCVSGSFFFTMEKCHPGDRMYDGLTSKSLVPALPAIPGQAPASPAQPAAKGPKE